MKRFSYKLDAFSAKQSVARAISFDYHNLLFFNLMKRTLSPRQNWEMWISRRTFCAIEVIYHTITAFD